MKFRNTSIWKISLLCITLGLTSHGFIPCSVSGQSGPDLSQVRIERIAVLPFIKGQDDTSITETLDAPVSRLYLDQESRSLDSDRILTDYVQEALQDRFGNKVVPRLETMNTYEKIYNEAPKDSLRSLAQKTGKALEANFIMAGKVRRYKERVGGSFGVESPASVAFDIYLIEVPGGRMVWNAGFDETQRSLSENIL